MAEKNIRRKFAIVYGWKTVSPSDTRPFPKRSFRSFSKTWPGVFESSGAEPEIPQCHVSPSPAYPAAQITG
jgi:hypothetical protein